MPSWMSLRSEPPIDLHSPVRSYPLFNRVSLETTSSCNRVCPFCPIADGRRAFPSVSMDDALFERLATELDELSFDGVVQLFLLNEPLLDPKYHVRLARLRAACSLATIYVSTNGDPLGRKLEDALEKLWSYYEAGATVINLNVYDTGSKGSAQNALYRRLQSEVLARGGEQTFNKYRKHNPRRKYVCVTDMRIDRSTDAGDVSVVDQFHLRGTNPDDPHVKFIREQQALTDHTLQSKVAKPPTYCARPQRHLVVRYDGDVPICCAVDPTDTGLPLLGSVRCHTLLDVWNSQEAFKYRYYTQQGLRVLPGCDGCLHRMAYPHVVRRVSVNAETQEAWDREYLNRPTEAQPG